MIFLIPSTRDINILKECLDSIIEHSFFNSTIIIVRNLEEFSQEDMDACNKYNSNRITIIYKFFKKYPGQNLGSIYKELIASLEDNLKDKCMFIEDDDLLLQDPESIPAGSIANYQALDIEHTVRHQNLTKLLVVPKDLYIKLEKKNNGFQLSQMIFPINYLKSLNDNNRSFTFNNQLDNDFLLAMGLFPSDSNIQLNKTILFKQRAGPRYNNISFSEFNKDDRWNQL